MRINSFIFTTGERESLRNVKNALKDANYWINYNKAGKDSFWRVFDLLMFRAGQVDSDLYIFTPDDFIDIDLEKIKEIHSKQDSPYAFNIINDGRNGLYNGVVPVEVEDRILCGFVDCGFFCNREALELIGFYIEECKATKDSSGVGRQLSKRFLKARVPMYKPVKSLATHGDHKSLMHPTERLNNPLTSI